MKSIALQLFQVEWLALICKKNLFSIMKEMIKLFEHKGNQSLIIAYNEKY
jgi:hypothetical protein